MIALIIADSFKKGMKSQGCAGLLKHSSKETLLQQQYRTIKAVFPKSKIVYVYGFDSKKLSMVLKDKYSNICSVYNHKYEEYNHGYSLYKSKHLLSGHNKCLITLGYDPIDKHILKNLKQSKGSSAALVDDNTKLGCIMHNDGTIHHIFYDLHNQIGDTYMIHKNEINILLGLLNDQSTHNMFLFELMNKVINHNGTIYAIK